MGNKKSKTNNKKEDSNKAQAFLMNNLSENIKKSIVTISITNQENKEVNMGTGFFLKFLVDNKIKFFLITYSDIVTKKNVEEKIKINLHYNELNQEKIKTIKLDNEQRFIKFFIEPLDATLVEIIPNDNINEDNFLFPDIKYKTGYYLYKDKTLYFAGAPINNLNKNSINICSGKITRFMNNLDFQHSKTTSPIIRGSPIFLADNILVVGFHRGGTSNSGNFIGEIIKYLEDNGKDIDSSKKENKKKNIVYDINSFKGVKNVRLKTTDNIVRDVDIDILKKSDLLENFLEDENIDGCEILLQEVNGIDLDLILQYLLHYKDMEPKAIPKPFPERTDDDFLRVILNDDWTFDYLQNITLEEAINLVNSAHYMEIDGLINIVAAKLAHEMCNCEIEEARKKFGIECDMTEEEIAEIDKYPLD